MLKPLLALSILSIAGCTQSEPTQERTLAGVSRAERSTQPTRPAAAPASERPPLLVNNTGIPASELNQLLAEAAGAVVVEEVILDRALADLVTQRNLTITRRDVEAEQAILLRSLQDDARLDPAQAQAMLESLRRSRGLGPARFEALLARNAQLRALVRPDIEVSNEDITRALAIEFGPAYRARIIRTQTEREASLARAEMTSTLREPPDLTKTPEQRAEEAALPLPPEKIDLVAALFAQRAVRSSTHESAPQGGLIPEFSPTDEAFPPAVRESLTTLKPGEISPVLVTANAAWLVLVERPIPRTTPPSDADRDRARARLTARRERLEMDRLARELLGRANVTVLDPHLRWSWESRPGDLQAPR